MRRIVSIIALLAVMAAPTALAHSVGADAYVSEDGTTIQVEAWFAGGKVPKKGTVVVLLPDGTEYLKGELTEGVFRFNPDRKVRFDFVVQLGEGHAKKFSLAKSELAKLNIPGTAAAAAPAEAPPAERTSEPARVHEEKFLAERVLIGIALIAALTAVAMAASAASRIRRVERMLEKLREKDDGPSAS